MKAIRAWLWNLWHVHDWLREPDRHADDVNLHYRFNRCWKCGAERGYIYTNARALTR